MTPLLVPDTSVMVKWFRQQEHDAGSALAIRSAYLAGEIHLLAPALALVEFANVLRYLDDLIVPQMHEAVDSLLDMDVVWVTPSRPMLKRAIEIAHAHETPVYDALFAALAEEQNALYITADGRFVKSVPDLTYVRLLAEFRLDDAG